MYWRCIWKKICIWKKETVPQEFKDANIIHLYKRKGDRACCDNHRGISLLDTAGKILAKIIAKRLSRGIGGSILPETQCDFRAGRSTVDMIFTARQIQEKCREQQRDLYLVFIDLTKAFDTVNREGLWSILLKLGCPDKLVNVIRSFHDGMTVRVVDIGGLSDAFVVKNGTKQGCVLAPLLFNIFYAAMLLDAFKDSSTGIDLLYRTDGGIFNLQRLRAKSKVISLLARDLLYADDCALAAHTLEDIQAITDTFAKAASRFGLTISIKKTEVLKQSSSNRNTGDVRINGALLKSVDTFCYLGSMMSSDATLDAEITHRIAKASSSFGRLRKRLWNEHGVSLGTKISVYRAVVLSTLLYASETWTLYRHHIRKLDQFHMRCLREIARIRWQDKVPNTEVLTRCHTTGIEADLIRSQLRWCGHLIRMPDSRLPKAAFYSELKSGNRRLGRPLMRFKDSLKANLRVCSIDPKKWEELALNRPQWRRNLSWGNFQVRGRSNITPPGEKTLKKSCSWVGIYRSWSWTVCLQHMWSFLCCSYWLNRSQEKSSTKN